MTQYGVLELGSATLNIGSGNDLTSAIPHTSINLISCTHANKRK